MNLQLIKDIIKDWRMLLYIVLAVLSIVYVAYAISSKKVVVTYSPILPNGSVIHAISYYSGEKCAVKSIQDFYSCIKNDTPLIVETNKGKIPIDQNETVLLYKTKIKEEGLIKLGIDISGGIRVILRPTENISYHDVVLAASVIEKRLNSYGLKSIDIKVAKNTEGESFIIVELPESEEDLIKIIQREGKFEAKINNTTVFTGKDIIAVHTYPPEGGIQTCYKTQGGWACKFYFTVYLNKDAAKIFAEVTKNIPVVFEAGQAYLKEDLILYLDGKEVDRLKISADLKGKVIDRAMISGLGFGNTKDEAAKDAIERMKELATILAYGSLPTTFDIVRIEKIPPTIGKIILSSVLLAGILAFSAVSLLIFIIYRRLKPAILIVTNMIIEIIMIVALGILIGQTFDLPAIAGILIAIGTGVDDQIIAIEEILRGRRELKMEKKTWKILFIVISAFITLLLAMFPLLFAGLGLLKGFAIMTIIGAAIGAFITRPAFIRLAQKVL